MSRTQNFSSIGHHLPTQTVRLPKLLCSETAAVRAGKTTLKSDAPLTQSSNEGEIAWIIRNEMPRTVEDVLARRLRILFMDARAAKEMAPAVAEMMAGERSKDETWSRSQVEQFNSTAANYILN